MMSILSNASSLTFFCEADLLTEPGSPSGRRRHSAGEVTRALLLESAERLFAVRGIGGVTLREIQVAAGQSNSSVITYHFGSKTGLVRALVGYRQPALDTERDQALAELDGATPRQLVGLVVRPMVSSVRRGELYVPFLARLAEDPRARSEYWPADVEDHLTSHATEEIIDGMLGGLPERVRRGRRFQFVTSALNLIGDHARRGAGLSDVQLANYIDGWAGMLTAPVSDETAAALYPEITPSSRSAGRGPASTR
jgi:AcrR family transcriptional regulator